MIISCNTIVDRRDHVQYLTDFETVRYCTWSLLSTIVLQLIIIIQTHHHHSFYFISQIFTLSHKYDQEIPQSQTADKPMTS